MLKYVGGKQDILTAIWRIIQGESSIRSGNGHCKHVENRSTPGILEYNWLTNIDYSVPTCTSWLESQGYIRHILSLFGEDDTFNLNFSAQKCDELYKKGCKSAKDFPGYKIQPSLYELDVLIPSIDNYIATYYNSHD
jgi:hypothetical protein